MKKLLISAYVCMVLLLAATTLAEQAYGADWAERRVYHTLWFCLLWGVLAAFTAGAMARRRWWRCLPAQLLHASFLVMLAGALATFVGGRKGVVHLTVGNETDSYLEQESGRPVRLPFTLRLDSFRIVRYPGTEAPADYISYLHGERPVSMNRILVREGFRFYQSSFDDDGQGSWLTVNYDPWGTALTYAGYLLLGISMLWLLVARGGEFRRLLRHPLLRRGGMLGLMLLCTGGPLQAGRRTLPALSRGQADSLARTQVIYQDRVVPFNTLARDFVLKLTGKPVYGGLTPEQVLGGWLLRPEVWQEEPMILIRSAELRRLLHLEGPYARLTDLFDGAEYRLQAYWQGGQMPSGRMSPLQKALVETDEKVGLILMLRQGTLIRPLPADGSVEPLSEAKVSAELLYNRVPFTRLLFMFNLTMGVLAFFRLIYRGVRGGAARRSGALQGASASFGAASQEVSASFSTASQEVFAFRSLSSRCLGLLFPAALWAAFLFQLTGYGLRWYIGGRIPLSNGYETMQFMALCALALSCLLRRRFPFTVPFGFLLSGFALLVSHLGQMNPQITPLMPVLVSPWLSAHVSLVMMSYALFAFMMLNGVLALCLRRSARMLMLLSRLLLYPAVFFLGAGIFLGAVWANASWGRYWAWDPKEVWALITLMVYGAAFHARSLRSFRRPLFFHIYLIAAFLTVLMTYFGVNYLLGGMHSYANG